MSDKLDLSVNCNFDDDDADNNCFGCIHFVFPIGCMCGNDDLEENDEEVNSDN